MLGNERRSDNRTEAEEGTVRHAGDDTGSEEHVVVRSQSSPDVADEEREHEADEHRLARHLGEHHRDERRADDDTERVRGDGVARLRDRDAETAGDVGQQPHRDELRRADGEAAERERRDRETGPRMGAVALVDDGGVGDVAERGRFGHLSIVPAAEECLVPSAGLPTRVFRHEGGPAR